MKHASIGKESGVIQGFVATHTHKKMNCLYKSALASSRRGGKVRRGVGVGRLGVLHLSHPRRVDEGCVVRGYACTSSDSWRWWR